MQENISGQCAEYSESEQELVTILDAFRPSVGPGLQPPQNVSGILEGPQLEQQPSVQIGKVGGDADIGTEKGDV